MWKTVCLTNMVPQFPATINQLFYTCKYIYVYNIMYWCIGELNKLYCIVLLLYSNSHGVHGYLFCVRSIAIHNGTYFNALAHTNVVIAVYLMDTMKASICYLFHKSRPLFILSFPTHKSVFGMVCKSIKTQHVASGNYISVFVQRIRHMYTSGLVLRSKFLHF